MRYLIFDTETTGIPNYKLPVNHDSQPYIVQLAALLCDDDARTLGQINLIIEPNGWTIPAEVANIHGISTELASQAGVSINMAMLMFLELYKRADYLIAHNIDFDLRMLRRYQKPGQKDLYDNSLTVNYCTKENSTDILKLPLTDKQKAAQARNPDWTPPGGWPKYKVPHLSECYQYFFGKDIDGAHNAMVDVEACRDVFFKLKELGKV